MRTLSSFMAMGMIQYVSAQAGPWGQCGGLSYSGPTSCQSGWSCVYLNDWFSNCQPGTTTLTTSSSTSAPAGTTTSSSVITTSSGSATSTSASATPTTPGGGSFPTVDGLKFNINGDTEYFAGSNAYWLPFLTNDADVDSVFEHLQETGLKVLRTWGFNDVNSVPSSGTVYFQLHDQSTGTATINTGADGLKRLDVVVAAAEKYGIKLIIPFVNNWNDYGGMNAYVNAYGGSKTGWYTNTKIQGVYQAYIKAVVSRYKDSPAIFAWELANEARCQDCSTDVIYNWVKTTAAYIKSLDAGHMVTTGEEGMGLTTGSDGSYPYTTYEGSDFAKNLAVPDIDFGTFHLYVSDWGISNNSWGNGWIESHAAACEAAGKPCLFEEYGIKDDHCSDELEWQDTSLTTTGMGGDLFWQYGEQLSTGASPDDHYTIYYESSDFQCAVVDHVNAI